MPSIVEAESYKVVCGTMSSGMMCIELHRKTPEDQGVQLVFLTADEAVVVARLLTDEVGKANVR